MSNPHAILRLPKVEDECGIKRTLIYERMKLGTFPQSVRLGARAVGWRRGDILDFLKDPAGYRAPRPA